MTGAEKTFFKNRQTRPEQKKHFSKTGRHRNRKKHFPKNSELDRNPRKIFKTRHDRNKITLKKPADMTGTEKTFLKNRRTR